jgi:hypothetical protein
MDISRILLVGQEYAALNHKHFTVHRKFTSKWKVSSIAVSLDNIFVFTDRKVGPIEIFHFDYFINALESKIALEHSV